MQTVILTFIIPIISMIFTCAFFALWWNDRTQWPVFAFGFCFGSLALGIVINIWLVDHSTPLGIVAYHLVSMAGMLALMWGVGELAQVKVPLLFSALTVLLTSPVLWFALQAGLLDAMRLAQNTNAAVITTLIAASLWHGTKRNWADRALVWVLVALAAFGFIRPVLTQLFSVVNGGDGSGAIILNAIHILALSTFLTLIALCLIASIVFGTMQTEREKASADPLTGLANRAAFEEQVDQLLQEAQRGTVDISLLIGDIDNFKSVNDTWGHGAGDKVISSFGRLIADRVRPKDAVGRVGGEEFCILIWDCAEASAVSLANRLRLDFSNAAVPGFSPDHRFAVSFGVAQMQQGEGYEHIFACAGCGLGLCRRLFGWRRRWCLGLGAVRLCR